MIYISEWLPNPVGSDAEGEWIELVNTGGSAVSLNGWHIEASNGKIVPLSGTLQGGAYLVLPRQKTKLTLRNSGETLALYNPSGVLAHTSFYKGSAPEGKSVSMKVEAFVFAAPTPGAPNAAAELALVGHEYPLGATLTKTMGAANILLMTVGASLLIAAVILYIVKHNEIISQLFFGADEEIR